jgi:hypothetical protein
MDHLISYIPLPRATVENLSMNESYKNHGKSIMLS